MTERDDGHVFRAEIYRQGILRCVDVPAELAARYAEWWHPAVVAEVGGRERATTLMRRADGGLRLFLHDELRRAGNVDTGDLVAIRIRPDESPVTLIPDEVHDAVAHVDGGAEALALLPPGLRREMLRFIDGAQSEATRMKRIARVTELIAQRAAKLQE